KVERQLEVVSGAIIDLGTQGSREVRTGPFGLHQRPVNLPMAGVGRLRIVGEIGRSCGSGSGGKRSQNSERQRNRADQAAASRLPGCRPARCGRMMISATIT